MPYFLAPADRSAIAGGHVGVRGVLGYRPGRAVRAEAFTNFNPLAGAFADGGLPSHRARLALPASGPRARRILHDHA